MSRQQDFYPRPPCGGRRPKIYCARPFRCISIHVPLAGDDGPQPGCGARRLISIHVPLAGDDQVICTPPVVAHNFYPRPPCGGRRWAIYPSPSTSNISIHVPLAGDDMMRRSSGFSFPVFLSTSPLRGTTLTPILPRLRMIYFYPRPPCGGRPFVFAAGNKAEGISIHVPLAGDDRLGVSL